ncbi:PRC-barrel domain-containing protein, partial [Candidatus Woesearchaeota archaeon]|nr:PRC-barrel domain-containing protein [Candidatus Woesearchaeota archaeon]
INEIYNMEVYTDSGDYFGSIEEAILASNKVSGWKIRATKNSFLSKALGGAKGVIVPHHFVRAIGDVMVISKSAIPMQEKEEEGEEEK